MEMPGYPGVFICVHGGDMGMICDTRDMSRAPTVNNLLKHNCSKLKELWITALNEQMKALKEAEGENAVTMPYLVHELALARDFDGKKEEKAFSENKKEPCNKTLFYAGDRNRTGTGGKSRRILSPVRLPVPPRRLFLVINYQWGL